MNDDQAIPQVAIISCTKTKTNPIEIQVLGPRLLRAKNLLARGMQDPLMKNNTLPSSIFIKQQLPFTSQTKQQLHKQYYLTFKMDMIPISSINTVHACPNTHGYPSHAPIITPLHSLPTPTFTAHWLVLLNAQPIMNCHGYPSHYANMHIKVQTQVTHGYPSHAQYSHQVAKPKLLMAIQAMLIFTPSCKPKLLMAIQAMLISTLHHWGFADGCLSQLMFCRAGGQSPNVVSSFPWASELPN